MQVEGPHIAGMSGQERAPGGESGPAVSFPGAQVTADRAGSVLHPQFHLEFQGDPSLASLWMIERDAADGVDVAARDVGSTAQSTRSSSPVSAVSFPVPLEDRSLRVTRESPLSGRQEPGALRRRLFDAALEGSQIPGESGASGELERASGQSPRPPSGSPSRSHSAWKRGCCRSGSQSGCRSV